MEGVAIEILVVLALSVFVMFSSFATGRVEVSGTVSFRLIHPFTPTDDPVNRFLFDARMAPLPGRMLHPRGFVPEVAQAVSWGGIT